MYQKYNIVSSIGTILSFFLIGLNLDLVKNLIELYSLKYLFYIILTCICIGILWSLLYCYKAFKSADISVIFLHNINNLLFYNICNNSNHTIIIRNILLGHESKTNHFVKNILRPYTQLAIPSMSKYKDFFLEFTKINKKEQYVIIICYEFIDIPNISYQIEHKLTKKEIKMFTKLRDLKE